MCHCTINIILGRVPWFYVWQEAIISSQQLISSLAWENQIRLIGIVAHHYLWGWPLVLLASCLLDLCHWWLNTQALVAFNSLLVVAWNPLWCSILLMLLPKHLSGWSGYASSWHRVIQLWLVTLRMLLLHFRLLKRFLMISLFVKNTYLSVIRIVQTLITQIVLSTCILPLHLSAILWWLLLLMVRLLLLVVMLLHLLHVFTLLVFLCRISQVLHLASIIVELLEILLIWANHHAWILTTTAWLALTGKGHVLMILLSNCSVWIVSWWFHKLVLRIQNIDVLQVLTRLLKQLLLILWPCSSKILMLRHLALSFMSIFKMRLGASNWILLSVWRTHVHHLNLALWMVYCALLVTRSSINNLLTTIWPLLALFHVACVYYLFLVTLQHLSWVSSNCTAAPLFETKTTCFWLRAQCDTILSFVYLVVHLACFVSAIDIETRRTANFIVSVVMLHIHRVSTHRRLRLTSHLSIKLIKLIVLLLLLMISTDVQSRGSWILGTNFSVFWLFTFQIVVWQITNLILKLLLLILVAIVHVLPRDDVVRVIYQILVGRRVRCILRWRPNLVLVLFFWDILTIRLILACLQHATRPIFFKIFLILLVWVLPSGRIRNLLRKKSHVMFPTIVMMLDLSHLVRTNLLMSMSSWIWATLAAACILAVVWILNILAFDLKHIWMILALISSTVFNMLTVLLVTMDRRRLYLLRVRVRMCLVICLHRIHIDCIIINCFQKLQTRHKRSSYKL